MDFNPLDLLAAAAALQRDDPNKPKESGGNSPSESDCDENNTDEATEEEDSNAKTEDKMGSARKVRSEIKRQNSCNLPSDVGKLFGADSERSVDTVSEEDLPGRTLRSHSWSAEDVTEERDSACDTDVVTTDTETVPPLVESSEDSSIQKDPGGADGSVVDSSSECPASTELAEESISKSVSESGTSYIQSEDTKDTLTGDACIQSEDTKDTRIDDANIQSENTRIGDANIQSEDMKDTRTGDANIQSEDTKDTMTGDAASVSDDVEDTSVDERAGDETEAGDVDHKPANICPLCRTPRNDEFEDENSLCESCGRTASAEEAEEPAESTGTPETDTESTNNEDKSEASFVAIVEDRTCSEPPESAGSSSLLESYLTSVQKPGTSLAGLTTDDGGEYDCDIGAGCSSIDPVSSVVFDHTYASQPGREVVRPDCYDTENGGESDSGGENSSTEEVEHRARSMSIESACLRFSFDNKQMTLPVKGQEDSDHMSTETSLLSPTSSVDSSLTDYPPLKLAPLSLPDKSVESGGQQQHTLIQGYSSSDGCDDRLGSPTSSVDSLQGQLPSKIGKFRIGTFASFSSSNMKSDIGPRNGSKSIRIKDHSTLSSAFFDKGLSSPPSVPQSPGIPSFLQSPCGDWDRSDAGSEVQDELGPPHCGESPVCTGSQESMEGGALSISSVHHDHDYCLREGQVPKDYGVETSQGKAERRKYSAWSKTKSGMVRHIKEPKVKSKTKVKKIKVEMFEGPTLAVTTPEEVPDFKQPFEVDMSPDRSNLFMNRTSRRRLEKLDKLQEQLELDNGSKLKITGKFKDDYVYYLNKSSRSRRRASTDLPPAPPTDKIIFPAPKPGDIIVPHLTDADIEAIKLRGKSGLSISEKYYGAGLSTALHSGTNQTPPAQSQTPPHPESMADMDSKIINTILSMENDSLGSPASAHESSMSDTVELYSPSEESVGISFMGENMTLTPDQVNLLLDAVRDVETSPEEIIDSSGVVKYNLDNNQNYDQCVEHLEITSSDQKSVDGASTMDETERRQSVSSAASELESESKDGGETAEPEESVIIEGTADPEPIPGTSIASVPVQAPRSVVVPPTVNPNESPVKALLEADLNTIGDSAPLRDLIPTLEEKPFDLLGNDFRLDKTDLFPDADTAVMDTPVSVPTSTAPAPAAVSSCSDYNTPWIVTVTMFWNDLPAIMIENQPYVRLVDIHKQILPAKDTGILKKRCQLLGIEVLNCSEMQRYFLVQYGRAYNSKSTLIVSKDDAKGLIGYYVTPQPRGSKLEDAVRREDPELPLDGLVASHQSMESHPVKISVSSASKKKIRAKAQSKVPAVVATEMIPAPTQTTIKVEDVPVPALEPKVEPAVPQVSKRLRHKKINFLELLKGEVNTDSNVWVEPTEEKKEEETVGENSRKSAGSPASPNSKRKAKLSDAEKLKLVKEELKKRKIELPDESAPEKKVPKVVEQDSEEENYSLPTSRRRFTSSRPRGANPMNGNRRSRLKKVGPLKVKIKGLLHFKKGKNTSAGEGDTKVIEIRHKDPKPTNTHPSVTQDGDVHLDLYQKKSSLCIKCCSCKKFFSLRNFLTHQHYPDDTEILTTVAQPQILEPRNIKLSEKKKLLWQEFNKRRKQLEGAKPVNETKQIVLSKPLNIVNKSVIPTSPPPKLEATQPQSVDIPAYKPGSALEAELRKKTDIPRFKQPVTVTMSARRKPSSSGVRVSSRKRKERQLFPIENYSFTKKAARLDLPLNGDVGAVVEAVPAEKAAVASNCVLTLSNGPELTQYTALQDAPEI